MDLTEELLSGLAERHAASWAGSSSPGRGSRSNLTRPWKRLTLREAIVHYAGVPPERLETLESVRAVLEEKGLEIPAGGTYGHLLMGLFEDTVEEHLFEPVFITEHPRTYPPSRSSGRTIRVSPNASSSTSPAWRWPTPSASSTIRTYRRSASAGRCGARGRGR